MKTAIAQKEKDGFRIPQKLPRTACRNIRPGCCCVPRNVQKGNKTLTASPRVLLSLLERLHSHSFPGDVLTTLPGSAHLRNSTHATCCDLRDVPCASPCTRHSAAQSACSAMYSPHHSGQLILRPPNTFHCQRVGHKSLLQRCLQLSGVGSLQCRSVHARFCCCFSSPSLCPACDPPTQALLTTLLTMMNLNFRVQVPRHTPTGQATRTRRKWKPTLKFRSRTMTTSLSHRRGPLITALRAATFVK